MIPTIIGLLISLAVLAVVFILVKWILGYFNLPGPLSMIIQIVFAVIAVVIVLKALGGLI